MTTKPFPSVSVRRAPRLRSAALCGIALSALAAASAYGCSNTEDVKSNVPPEVGAMYGEGNDVEISEDEACDKLRAAADAVIDDFGCDIPVAACPDYLRTAGSTSCQLYDEGSVDSCIEVIEGYRSCAGFTDHPCIVLSLGEEEGCAPEPIDTSDAGQSDAGENPESPTDAGQTPTEDAGGPAGDAGSMADAGDAGDAG
jgi:hypothetical protein